MISDTLKQKLIKELREYFGSDLKRINHDFKVLYDADWLVNLKDTINIKDKSKLKIGINKVFLTDTGKKLAEKIYLGL